MENSIVSRRLAGALVVALALLLVAPFARGAEAPKDATKRPNILFIFSDDHAYQAISAYGFGLNQTPNIDRLAKEGMRFDRCLTTYSLCGPSRACVLTGKYSHLNGFYNNYNSRFDGSQVTMPKLLQAAGLPDGDHRQVAPGERPDRLRFLGNPARPGRSTTTRR